MLIAIEADKAIHKLPHIRYSGMENVRSELMDFYSGFSVYLTTHIAANNISSLQDQYLSSRFGKTSCDSAAPYASAGDNYVNLLHTAESPLNNAKIPADQTGSITHNR